MSSDSENRMRTEGSRRMSEQKRPKVRVFFMDGEVVEGELGGTYFEAGEVAVPMLRIREQEGRQHLIPFFNIKCIEPLEGFDATRTEGSHATQSVASDATQSVASEE